MKAMKAMAAMKAMRAMKKKVVSARTAVRQCFAGKLDKTKGGLSKSSLVKNKNGRIVSKTRSLKGKKSPWIAAVKAARSALKIKGFAAIRRAHHFMPRPKSSTVSERFEQLWRRTKAPA